MGIRLSIFNLHEMVAEVTFKKVYLQEAADGFLMRLQGDLKPGAGAQYGVEILDLSAEIALITPANKFLCNARPNGSGGSIWGSTHGEGQVHLQAFLSAGALEAIEAARNGGELDFSMSLRGIATLQDSGQYVKAGTKVLSASQERVSFARSDWENALEGCGYGKLIRFTLSLPKAEYSADVIGAYRELDKAQRLLRQGNYREVIVACRSALNTFRNGDITKDKALFTKAATESKNLTEPERVALVRASTLTLSQSGPHAGEVPEEMPPSYAKAAAMLYLTGLTAWLEEQRRETEIRS